MKVAIYTRVSTGGQNPELQRRELEEYARRHDWELVGVYEDVVSGSRSERPGRNRLMEDARARKFDAVICWSLDRFGRSLVDCIRTIEDLDRQGVRFLCTNQNIDTDNQSPTGRLVVQIMAAFAEFEGALIRERVKSGLRRYNYDLAAGRVGHEVHSRSGKDLAPHRPRRIFDRQKVFELRTQGHSIRKIAKRLGISHGTVERTLNTGPPPS